MTFKELLGPPLLVMILIELGMRNVDRVGEICEIVNIDGVVHMNGSVVVANEDGVERNGGGG